MKVIAVVIAISLGMNLGMSFSANAQTAAAAPAAPAAAPKKKPDPPQEARTEGPFCKWKGGDFSPGAEFCVFSGRALLCENGIWKREDLAACIVTPAVLP